MDNKLRKIKHTVGNTVSYVELSDVAAKLMTEDFDMYEYDMINEDNICAKVASAGSITVNVRITKGLSAEQIELVSEFVGKFRELNNKKKEVKNDN